MIVPLPRVGSIFLGTDNWDAIYSARILYGGRLTLFICWQVTGLAAVNGIILGAVSGFMAAGSTISSCDPGHFLMAVPNLGAGYCACGGAWKRDDSQALAVGISAILTFARTIRGPIP